MTELLEKLGLATAGQVRAVGRRVRRLARDLPLFESVWVDGLAQARILTPYQAAEINAGRGGELAVGPYVLCEPLGPATYAAFFRARRRTTREYVRLALAPALPRDDAASVLAALKGLAAAGAALEVESLAPVRDAGLEGGRLWSVCDDAHGPSAAQWMVHNGRFPPEVVLEIARQMVAALARLEEAGGCHGDVSASGLVLSGEGAATLPMPGLRAVLRPREGCAQADLPPEAYDCLAPERVAEGSAPAVASDLYACGCLWWHLLTGRAPLPGATAPAKLRAIQTHRIADVRTLAPDAPNELAALVAACIERDPARRPATFAEAGARLGPPTHAGRTATARCVRRPWGWRPAWTAPLGRMRRSHQAPLWLAGAAAAVVAAVALGWSAWNAAFRPPLASIRGEAVRPLAAAPAERTEGNSRTQAGPAPVAPAPAPAALPHVERRGPDHPAVPAPPGEPVSPPDLVLPAGKPVAIESLALAPGQAVTGPPGARAAVRVPPGGLLVVAENVRFEDLDFVWDHEAPGRQGAGAGAMIDLRAARAEFRACSFRAAVRAQAAPAAVRWTHPADRSAAEMTLPSGRIDAAHCVFEGVSAAVECRTLGARAVRMTNVLCLGPGPLVRFDHFPGADEPLAVSLARTTVRGARAVLEVARGAPGRQPGRILIDASECVLAPDAQGALLVFGPEMGDGGDVPGRQPEVGRGPQGASHDLAPSPSSDALLGAIQWTGQGSLVEMETPVAVWTDARRRGTVLDDSVMSIAGLVRSRVGFAAEPGAGPAASRIIRWQAPLRSASPPGADPDRLPPPE